MDAHWTIATAGRALRAGTISAVELTQGYLDQIAAQDERLRAYVTVTTERALADARRADLELHANKDRGPLHGIPITLKDVIMTQDIRTTAGSRVLDDYIPTVNAEVARDLSKAGTVLLGKTNTHEFARGVFSPPTRNPWNTDHIAGGSSGGPAAAIAAGMALGAVGTDTGGSIRIPSACCGVTGFKPTYGAISRSGVIDLSASFDHVGPIARTVEDCALLFDEMAVTPRHPPYAAQIVQGSTGLHIGILGGYWQHGVESEVLALVHAAAASIRPNLPVYHELSDEMKHLFETYTIIASVESSDYHQRQGWYPALADRYTAITRASLAYGGTISAVDFIRAQAHRALVTSLWNAWMDVQNVDVLLAPTLPMPAPTVATTEDPGLAPGTRERLLSLNFPFNVMGMPALSVPCGFTTSGLPVGMQIIARAGADAQVLRVGYAFQQATEWHERMPRL